ncbi:hypothetical protein IX307_002882 [Bacteroides pyogenes]|uniref:hypothetical protein n=1 Tax=Bacteroides pyogenes TaxID=310300 RepID=UPI001652F539|nr:hypothetical protein [Bacteroides pyogenes]MBR8707122.1 hypothetical protein [Bacteroides pyogenes]MBR8726520.1 hypothetical protein [Bacteroides pyogenes]MBR8739951.1 hypothetical protein [Bacteroides pyogenes]MBR8755666.1 hypothetical protein [Bacteroides pyogenes]MBR8788528.1 hypothetical protein [Bacteroides pyogenes]
MRKKIVKITFVGIILSIGLLSIVYHFRRDIFNYPIEYYVLESDTTRLGKKYRHSIVLLSNVPYLEKNIKKRLEETFWEYVTLDTLRYYMDYTVRYYRETKYLTRNFKEGKQYIPLYSKWDNAMDWRNHYEDRLGRISFRKREDGTGFYIVEIYSSGYGFRVLVDIVNRKYYEETFERFDEIYQKKRKELRLKKNDLHNETY